MISSEEIAKIAGVSRSTVSRVINNEPGVHVERVDDADGVAALARGLEVPRLAEGRGGRREARDGERVPPGDPLVVGRGRDPRPPPLEEPGADRREAPLLFRTRWTLSYLRGPLTREEIKRLLEDVKLSLDNEDLGKAFC